MAEDGGKGLDGLALRMLGGSVSAFFADHWRQRLLHVPSAAAGLAGGYGVEQFVADLESTQSPPYPSVGARGGNRHLGQHQSADAFLAAVGDGDVASMKLSRLWHRPSVPESWIEWRALFGALCRQVSMLYLDPDRSEDVDLFLAGPRSELGVHYDTTEVFTVQLFGERTWTVENHMRTEELLAGMADPGWNPAKEIELREPSTSVTLSPGDALYVPAYSVHHVTGVSWSVSLSLGLRTFNEVDVVEHLLGVLRATTYAGTPPLDSIPSSQGESHVEAKLAVVRRVRKLLESLEAASLATAMSSLDLPSTLASVPPVQEDQPVPPVRRGFALVDDS